MASSMRSRLWLSVALMLVAVGCQRPDYGVAVDYDPLTVFPPQATFAWDTARSEVPSDERLVPLEFERLIREEAAAAFGRRGYVEATAATPDYLLSYRFRVLDIVGGKFTRAVGTLWLSFHQTSGDRKVWSGGVNSDIHVGHSEAERRLRFQEMLTALLEGFPPTQRKE